MCRVVKLWILESDCLWFEFDSVIYSFYDKEQIPTGKNRDFFFPLKEIKIEWDNM
jgi:hypothetical protein